jgi:PmbA protein
MGDAVFKGKSLLAGKVGAQIVSSLLTIRDDGTLPKGMATAPFDGEGVAQQNTVVVSDGILQGYLYDTLYAGKMGTVSTGNSARGGVKGLPHLGATNLFIENGCTPAASLIAGIGRGLLLTDLIGMHTANSISGDFSVGAAGFLIENGQIVHPVKGIAIAGNILDLFSTVVQLGDDLRFYSTVGAPSLLVSSMDISGL